MQAATGPPSTPGVGAQAALPDVDDPLEPRPPDDDDVAAPDAEPLEPEPPEPVEAAAGLSDFLASEVLASDAFPSGFAPADESFAPSLPPATAPAFSRLSVR